MPTRLEENRGDEASIRVKMIEYLKSWKPKLKENPVSTAHHRKIVVKIIGIATFFLKIARVFERSLEITKVLIRLFLYCTILCPEIYELFALHIIATVVLMLQLLFIIIFVFGLWDGIKTLNNMFIANAVCFAVEVVAKTLLLFFYKVYEDEIIDEGDWYIPKEICVTGLNTIFLLAMRSHISALKDEKQQLPM